MKHALKTTLTLASILAAVAVVPLVGARADTAPNIQNNATLSSGSTGNYDGFDRFRDESGRPLSGWEYLFHSAA